MSTTNNPLRVAATLVQDANDPDASIMAYPLAALLVIFAVSMAGIVLWDRCKKSELGMGLFGSSDRGDAPPRSSNDYNNSKVV